MSCHWVSMPEVRHPSKAQGGRGRAACEAFLLFSDRPELGTVIDLPSHGGTQRLLLQLHGRYRSPLYVWSYQGMAGVV